VTIIFFIFLFIDISIHFAIFLEISFTVCFEIYPANELWITVE
jgi:hypothetical protein